jgi:hypothetical protein
MITYWRKNGQAGMRAIARGALGQAEVDMNDLLARNALIQGALTTGYSMYGSSGSGADFSSIATTDLYDPALGADIWLGMANRGVANALGPTGAEGSIVAYTSPGVIYDIQKDSEWITVREYLSDRALLNYEVGAHKNVRYVQTPKCTLWNCGTVIAQAPINAMVHAGDGAPARSTTKVDGVYMVGQEAGVTPYISLGTFGTGTIASLAVNDILTFHQTRTSAFGITNGVNFIEGKLTNRRVVSIDTVNGRVTLDQPFLVDFDSDLGGGVYGYVTKGRHIHATIFIGGPQAIVAGVAQQPQFYALDPIDDFKAIYRFSFDQYIGYQPYQPEVFEVIFTAGTFRVKGPKTVQ